MTATAPLDALVVGAGPTGLTAACELTRRGARCLAIDRSPERTRFSKALGVHARTLEVFERMGVAEEAITAGRKLRAFNAYARSERLFHLSLEDLDTRYPFVLILPQGDTERILEAQLARLGGALERGVELVSLSQDADGVTAVVREVPGGGGGGGAGPGAERTIRARWLIGADGARSAVRGQLGLGFEGAKYEETFALADLSLADGRIDPNEAHAFLGALGALAIFPLPAEGRYRIVADVTASLPASGELEPTLALFQRLLEERGPPGVRASDSTWLSVFRIHRRMVPRYRVGRAFVAGDAAHIHSPAGGQGMNTGIQDAENLVWKLALVVSGGAREALLDTYEAERRPVAEQTLADTDRATFAGTLRNPLGQLARNHLVAFALGIEPVRRKVLTSLSEIGISYGPNPFLGEHTSALVGARLTADRTSERASMGDVLEFHASPRPGTRAPDVALRSLQPGGSGGGFLLPGRSGARLGTHLGGVRHSLLLFDGLAATAEGYRNLERIAALVRGRWSDRIDVTIVVPAAERPAGLRFEGDVILDAGGAAHWRYGASAECLYLVRPDGVVGYRSQPADARKLEEYLERAFA